MVGPPGSPVRPVVDSRRIAKALPGVVLATLEMRIPLAA